MKIVIPCNVDLPSFLRNVPTCTKSKPNSAANQAAIAQLGERQTEDLKVPGSIPGLGIYCTTKRSHNYSKTMSDITVQRLISDVLAKRTQN